MVNAERTQFARQKLLEGWNRLAAEWPEIDFSLPDTVDTLDAEQRVAQAVADYESGKSGLAEIRMAFQQWTEAWKNNRRPVSLFG